MTETAVGDLGLSLKEEEAHPRASVYVSKESKGASLFLLELTVAKGLQSQESWVVCVQSLKWYVDVRAAASPLTHMYILDGYGQRAGMLL